MSSKRAARNLDPVRVQMALKVQRAKHELAMKMVAERVQKDAEFAADVLKIGGEFLRQDIKKSAQETVEKAKTQAIADRWDKTGLLDGNAHTGSHAIFIESQETPEAVKNALSQGVILHQSGKTTVMQKDDPNLPDGIKIAIEAVENEPIKLIQETPQGAIYSMPRDGGGESIVHETELPDFPRDGE